MIPGSDPDLDRVIEALRAMDPDGRRTAAVLRDTLDQLYHGQRTGRYRWDQLYKTEKTHCGTLVEINMQREFEFDDGNGDDGTRDFGKSHDYQIAGVDVDCKFSQTLRGWMIPPEARDELCLLLWASDEHSKWSMGVVRASDDILLGGKNRDQKTSISAKGVASVTWLFDHAELEPNLLFALHQEPKASRPIVDQIFSHEHGAPRVVELFRLVQQRRISRVVVATVARQADYMKRIRGNGGARSQLRPEGIIIVGQSESHRAIAKQLNLPVPRKGESVSARVVPCTAGLQGAAKIGQSCWRVASTGDPVVEAPILPR